MSKRRLGNGNSQIVDELEEDDEIESTQDERPNKLQRVENGTKQQPQKQQQQQQQQQQKRKQQQVSESSESESDSGSSDSDSSDDDDDDTDSETERENIRQEQLLRRGITEPEAGIIEEIRLENFMCHRHFKLELGPNVNFISGENGSGKSAILIGLIVCLGAKATFTNRGSKLSDLVKTDTNNATITVRLRNQGPEAYKPEKYGPSIIIERKISKVGSSGYRVKDHQGKTISDKLNDVSLILEQFNIQIDNPMSILTQDTSRQFLNSAGPQEKYKSFLAATQLDKMTKDYTTINDHILRIKDLLSQKAVVIEELEKKVNEYNKEYKDLQHVVDLERKINDFQNVLAWCFVGEAEREVRRKDAQIKTAEKTTIDADIKKTDEALASYEQSIANIQEEIKEFQEQIQQFEQKREANIREAMTVEREEANIQGTIDGIKKSRQQNVVRRTRQQNSINEIKQRNAQMANNQAKMADIERKNQQIVEMDARVVELRQEREQLLRDKEDAKQAYSSHRGGLAQMEREINALKTQLNSLKQSQTGDRTVAYGGKGFKDFLQKLDQSKRSFGKPPIGPVGLNLNIKNEKWAFAIETALTKSVLKTFLVFSIEDGQNLQKIARQYGVTLDFSRIPETSGRYSTSDHDAMDPNIVSVLRLLDSPSHYIINYLIDSKKIETIALGHNRQEIEGLLYEDSKCPRGLSQMFDIKGNCYSKTFSGNQSFQSARDSGEATMLKVNADAAIQRTQREIEQKMPAYNQQKKVEADLSNNVHAIDRKIIENEKDTTTLSRRILALRNEIRSIEETLVQQTDDTTDLENGLLEIDEVIKQFDEEIKENVNKKQQIAAKKQPFINENNSIEDQIAVLKNQLNKIETHLRNFFDQKRKSTMRRQQLVQQQGKNAQEREALKAEYDQLAAILEEKTNKATLICERVPVPEKETSHTLTNKINQYKAQVQKESKGKRSRQEALKAFTDANNSLREIVQQRDNIDELARTLQANLSQRFKAWQRFRLSIARRSNQFFNIFLSRKGYTGSLTFNHPEGKLDINVDLQKALPSNQTGGVKGDTKGLSGGERSFSTVSLLLAFWENMECPFRAMDEFDVFMDEVNRSISINLLMSKAEENRSKQYIFVTPLALNHIKNCDYIKVFKISPPARSGGDVIVTSS